MPWYPLNQIDVKTNGLEEKGLYIKPPYKPIFDTTTLKVLSPPNRKEKDPFRRNNFNPRIRDVSE